MIKINLESTVIPIEIGELKFEFDYDDNSLKKIKVLLEEMDEKMDSISSEDTDDLTKTHELLVYMFESLLGEGTFDKVYEVMPSTIGLIDVFAQLAEGLSTEIMGRRAKEKTSKYLHSVK